ncbi:MAG: DUF982 domain-containing protein [Phyllobacterium sp.]|nr:DUF982 domain-containing protein [Phyllobacterium sp.]
MNSPSSPILRFCFGPPLTIRSLADAKKAFDRPWPDRNSPNYLRARELFDTALAGHCRPQVAIDALLRAAAEQGLLRRRQASDALSQFDALCAVSKPPAPSIKA